MKLVSMVKLRPSERQSCALLATIERFNAACNEIADVAFRQKVASKFRLQKIVYYSIRAGFGLSAQMAIRAICKVADVYKCDRPIKPTFRPRGAICYDQRNLSWKGRERVSILTLQGREVVPIAYGPGQKERLAHACGQADLIFREGMFFLAVTVDVAEPIPEVPVDWLGVDLGIVNIAVDSDGETYSGGKVNGLRKRSARLRARLQARGTKSAKRVLKRRRHKEARFAACVNHTISKHLVAKAKDTAHGIALEDLRGIRERTTVSRARRRVPSSWSFHQLRSFIEYKAANLRP